MNKNKREAKETFFERNYTILRAFLVSSIFSLLGYSKSDLKYAKSKNLKTLADDFDDFIFTDSPFYNETIYYLMHTEEFNRLYAAAILITLYKNLDVIIQILINSKKKNNVYPIDEVDEIFRIAQGFVRSALDRNHADFLKWNHKMHKKLILIRRDRIKGFKYAEYVLLEEVHKTPSIMTFMPIVRFGYMVMVNQHLPRELDDQLVGLLNGKELKKFFTVLGMHIMSLDQEKYTETYKAFLKANPACVGMFASAPKISKAITMIEFVKYIMADRELELFVDNYIYP